MKKIKYFPELRQYYNYDCGASALQSVLIYYGYDIREDDIVKVAGTTNNGTSPDNLIKAAKHYGLKSSLCTMTVTDIKQCIDNQVPVIIPMQAWEDKKITNMGDNWDDGHYVIPVAYDKTRIYFEDPSCFNRSYLTFSELEERWHDYEEINGVRKEYINCGIKLWREDGKKACKPKLVNLAKVIK
jgi:ABC-type bacteriocin/lantibiotic exporter with double-glycine peptidase domain